MWLNKKNTILSRRFAVHMNWDVSREMWMSTYLKVSRLMKTWSRWKISVNHSYPLGAHLKTLRMPWLEKRRLRQRSWRESKSEIVPVSWEWVKRMSWKFMSMKVMLWRLLMRRMRRYVLRKWRLWLINVMRRTITSACNIAFRHYRLKTVKWPIVMRVPLLTDIVVGMDRRKWSVLKRTHLRTSLHLVRIRSARVRWNGNHKKLPSCSRLSVHGALILDSLHNCSHIERESRWRLSSWR